MLTDSLRLFLLKIYLQIYFIESEGSRNEFVYNESMPIEIYKAIYIFH